MQTGRPILLVNLARAAALLILAGAIATQVSVMPAVYAAALIYGVAEPLVV
ncbi:hypothetical protein JOD60_001022 [Microbacterium aurum]|nr:hypothetical protein [Microbacterium aurum]